MAASYTQRELDAEISGRVRFDRAKWYIPGYLNFDVSNRNFFPCVAAVYRNGTFQHQRSSVAEPTDDADHDADYQNRDNPWQGDFRPRFHFLLNDTVIA